MRTPEHRYRNDPVFHRLVDVLLLQLRHANMTATEIREAAILAAQIHEITTVRQFWPEGPREPATDADLRAVNWVPASEVRAKIARALEVGVALEVTAAGGDSELGDYEELCRERTALKAWPESLPDGRSERHGD